MTTEEEKFWRAKFDQAAAPLNYEVFEQIIRARTGCANLAEFRRECAKTAEFFGGAKADD